MHLHKCTMHSRHTFLANQFKDKSQITCHMVIVAMVSDHNIHDPMSQVKGHVQILFIS